MKLKSIVLATTVVFVSSAFAANEEVYTWKDQNGVVNFSQEKPTNSTDVEQVKIDKPVIIGDDINQNPQRPNPAVDRPVNINQGNVQRYEQQAQQQGMNAQNYESANSPSQGRDYQVSITSPQNGQAIFSKEEYIDVTTSPELTAKDSPRFMVNGSDVNAQFKDGVWQIARPEPGEVKLSITGTTLNRQNIVSSNTSSFFVRNGWGAQSINDSKSGGLINPNGNMAPMAPMAPMAKVAN